MSIWRKFWQLTVLIVAFNGAVAHASTAATVDEPSMEYAQSLVKSSIQILMDNIAEVKPYYETEPDRFYDRVETILGPYLDFRRIARGVMSKHYKKANKADFVRFTKVLKQSLMQTYAGALVNMDEFEIKVLPPAVMPKPPIKTAKVNLEIVSPSGQVFPIVQSLYFSKKQKRWKVKNIIVNGINVGILFRDQFNRLVIENEGSIARAVDNWDISQYSGRGGQTKAGS